MLLFFDKNIIQVQIYRLQAVIIFTQWKTKAQLKKSDK